MNKKIYITESQFKNLIGEMAYPISFNFEEFKKINSFAGRVRITFRGVMLCYT